jgi:hypothetical protein
MLKAFRGSNMGLFNNAASSWNHEFFWKCLRSRAFLFSCVRAWQLNSFPALLVCVRAWQLNSFLRGRERPGELSLSRSLLVSPHGFFGGGVIPSSRVCSVPLCPRADNDSRALDVCAYLCAYLDVCAYVCAYLPVHRAEGVRRQT